MQLILLTTITFALEHGTANNRNLEQTQKPVPTTMNPSNFGTTQTQKTIPQFSTDSPKIPTFSTDSPKIPKFSTDSPKIPQFSTDSPKIPKFSTEIPKISKGHPTCPVKE